MAFIRQYSRRAMAAEELGDPGFGKFFKRATRIPRGLRKLKVGRFLGKIASPLLSFVPGVGGILSQLAQKFGISPEVMGQLAQAYGIPVGEAAGDLMGDPGPPAPAKKRKRAASGTKAKAKAKEEKRAERRQRGAPTPRPTRKGKKPKGKPIGLPDIEIPPGLADALGKLAGGAGEALGRDPDVLLRGVGLRKGDRLFGGGARRRLNPANVKALNRSLRRVEGFEKLASRVMGHKLFRRVRGRVKGGAQGSRARGHRQGCACVVCRRAA